jgi:putative toxin-antitoxin system antitoxin component (TIGR02293 family)
MAAIREITEVLGVAKPKGAQNSALYLITLIEKGLPTKVLDRLSSSVAPSDASFKYRIVKKATLARRYKRRQRLSAEESGRIARLARTWSVALDVWGSDSEARSFMFRPHQLLEGRRPIDLAIGSDPGARMVEDILRRLQYGSAV